MRLPVVYGTTHDQDSGALTATVPRVSKVNIGKPKDSGLHLWIQAGTNPDTQKPELMFALEIGRAQEPEMRGYPRTAEGKKLLQRDYNALLKDPSVVKRKAPVKLPYFTFLKEAGDGTLVHDIESIDRHGARPREIDIVITDEEPFKAGYFFWDAKGLKCKGDGRDALRSINFVPTPEDAAAAEQAKSMDRKFFPIVDGCASRGCPYAKTIKNAKGYDVKQCGLGASFSFQLVNDIRLGAKAEYATTGIRSIRQLTAGLYELAAFTGGGDPARGTVRGIPLVLSVSQFKTNHNNQPGTAYAVKLEFRAESVPAMQAKVMEAAKTFGGVIHGEQQKTIAAAAPLQIEAPVEETIPLAAEDEVDEEDTPRFHDQLFNGEESEDGPEDGPEESPKEDFTAAKAELMMQMENEGLKTQAPLTNTDPGEQEKPRRGINLTGAKK